MTDWDDLPDTMVVDFGFYEEEVPEIPDMIDDVNITIWFIFYGAVCFGAVFIIFLYARLRKSYNDIPEETRKTVKRKKRQMKNDRVYDGRELYK